MEIICTQLVPIWREKNDYEQVLSVAIKKYKQMYF